MYEVKDPIKLIYSLIFISIVSGIIISIYIFTRPDNSSDQLSNNTLLIDEETYSVEYSESLDRYFVKYKEGEGEFDVDKINETIEAIEGENYEDKVEYDIPGAVYTPQSEKDPNLTLEEERKQAKDKFDFENSVGH